MEKDNLQNSKDEFSFQYVEPIRKCAQNSVVDEYSTNWYFKWWNIQKGKVESDSISIEINYKPVSSE